LLSGLDVSLAELEHAIEQACEFVGSGINGRWGSEARLNASDEGTDGRFTLHGALSGQAQRRSSAIGIFSRFGLPQKKWTRRAQLIVG